MTLTNQYDASEMAVPLPNPFWGAGSDPPVSQAPLYYREIAERFSAYDFRAVARALGLLHAADKLWQDTRGRICLRGPRIRQSRQALITVEETS